jgi:cyanate lyase
MMMMPLILLISLILLINNINGQTCSGVSKAIQKEQLVERLLDAKAKSGLTFDQIAEKIGLTNAYTAQLFMNQAQLKPATALKLKEAIPGIADEDIATMKKEPFRSFNPTIMQEPVLSHIIILIIIITITSL